MSNLGGKQRIKIEGKVASPEMHSMKHLVKNGKQVRGKVLQTPQSFQRNNPNNRIVGNKQVRGANWPSGGARQIHHGQPGNVLRGSKHAQIPSRNLRNGLAEQRPGVSGVSRQGFVQRGGVGGGFRRKF